MSFFLKGILAPAALACLGVGCWQLHNYLNDTPKLLDLVVAGGLKPITYSTTGHLSKYHDRFLKYKSELSTDFPHLSFDLSNEYESSQQLRNLCSLTLGKEFVMWNDISKRDLRLAKKYCTMNLKDQILETGDVRILGDDDSVNNHDDYKLSFENNKDAILKEFKNFRDSKLSLDKNNLSGGGKFLEELCNESLEKPYSNINYRLFRHVKNWCTTPDPLF